MLKGRRCLVVGGGEIGLEKVEGLLACDADVTVYRAGDRAGARRARQGGLGRTTSSELARQRHVLREARPASGLIARVETLCVLPM